MTGIYLECSRCGAKLDRTERTPSGTYHWSQWPQLLDEARELGWTGALTRDSETDLCPACSREPHERRKVTDLGTCCVCCGSDHVVHVIMINRRGPQPGKGWGCVVCGLPLDGAIVVMCNACIARDADPVFVCDGFPSEGKRVPIHTLSPEPFDHDPASHRDDDETESVRIPI
jgi:hypothetical protein